MAEPKWSLWPREYPRHFPAGVLLAVSMWLWAWCACAASSQPDDFQLLQDRSQLPSAVRLLSGQSLTPERTRSLWDALIRTPANGRSYAPRTVLARLLRQVSAAGTSVPYAELLERLGPFNRLALARPDGYVCDALSGEPLARLSHIQVFQGELYVQGLRVGAFYFNEAGVFFAVDSSLRKQGTPVGELPLGRDPLTAALLGAEQAGTEVVVGLASLFTQHPLRTLEDLGRLPSALAGLIASSPEYFGRYRDMNLEDQVREASRLATHLLTLWGGAPASGSKLAAAARMPRLTLSAAGELVLGGVSEVSAGAAVVGSELLGASLVLMAAQEPTGSLSQPAGQSWPPPPSGPGQWVQKNEFMSDESRAFQSHATGAPPGWVYRIRTGPGPRDYVDFDGFNNGILLEVKGIGYLELLRKAAGKNWLNAVRDMLDQAKRQYAAARGVPIRWSFAEKEVADMMRQLFAKEGLAKIRVE